VASMWAVDGVEGSELGDDRTRNLDLPSQRLWQRLRTAWKQKFWTLETGTAAGFMWLNRRQSGSRWGMTSAPLVVFPIPPSFSMV
jgi:hypothetical protein